MKSMTILQQEVMIMITFIEVSTCQVSNKIEPKQKVDIDINNRNF